MSPRKWKARLKDMEEAANKILDYCKNIKNEEAFKADKKTLDACIRNLQVLGDAAKVIPASVQHDYNEVPWTEIKGMRNILVHEYFGVSPTIIWKAVKLDLPNLAQQIHKIIDSFETPIHSWKICPAGEIFVRSAKVDEYDTKGYSVREHLRKEHCREGSHTTKHILTPQETEQMVEIFFRGLSGGSPSSNALGFGKKGIEFDYLIRGWTQYWNDVLKPDVLLDANIVKALIASESSFKSDLGKGKRGAAKGLMQLMPRTIRYLTGYKKELKDHLFEFSENEIYDPNFNIAAGVRWLFRKKETASARLKRTATWEETVSEYKDYLHRYLKNPKANQKGMDVFKRYLKDLKE